MLSDELTEQDQAFYALPISAFELKEAPELADESPEETIYGYTYLRVNACATPDSDNEEICFDAGASCSLIRRNFLKKLDYTVENCNGKVKGVGDKLLGLNQWATFTIHLLGLQNGKPTLMKFKRSAWVVDYLDPNLLLGNEFLDLYKADIDYGTRQVRL